MGLRAAQREVSRAQELDPRYVAVYSCYLHYQGALRQPDEAVAEIRGALDRDPLSLFINAELGCAFYYARQYDKAIGQMRHTLEMDPNYAKARHSLARAYGQKGMYREAIAELIRARTLSGGAAHMVAELAYVYAVSGNTGEARKLLGELKGQATRTYVSPYLIAFIYLARRQR
jgi:tetratricopeptide (TPR) repeat protein